MAVFAEGYGKVHGEETIAARWRQLFYEDKSILRFDTL